MSARAAAGAALGTAAVVALAFGAHLPTGLVVAGDGPELVVVATTGGVAHFPGYALWTVLAGAWLAVVPGPPAVALGALGVGLFALAAGALAWRLVATGSRPLAAAGLALCWAVLPVHWAAVPVPEVHALELALWAGALALATGRGAGPALALALAGLAVGHRPTALALVVALGWTLRGPGQGRKLWAGAAAGLGLVLASVLAVAAKAADPATPWLPAALGAADGGYWTGTGLAGAALAVGAPGARLASLGLQGLALGLAALGGLAHPSTRGLGLAALALWGWLCLWGVHDAELAALPLLLLGTLVVGRAVGHRGGQALAPALGALALALGAANRARAPVAGDGAAAVAEAVAAAPPGALLVATDATLRGALELARREAGRRDLAVVAWPGPDAQGLAACVGGGALWVPETRRRHPCTGPVWALGPPPAGLGAAGLAARPVGGAGPEGPARAQLVAVSGP